jgi:hypothetical protein
MRFDPLRGALVSLLVVAASLVWFLAIRFDGEALFRRLGYAMHAATLLAIFAAIAGLAVAGLFLRFHHVRAELLAGRRVVARWRVDEKTFRAFAPVALDSDRQEKRQALMAVAFFVVAIFGAFALFDHETAVPMLSMAGGVILVMALAFVLGQRVMAAQLVYRGGEAIVGERGLLFNGVLHVWGAPLSWLTGAAVSRDGRVLEIGYAYLSRLGPQYVATLVPIPSEAGSEAQAAAARLQALAG